MFRDKSNEENDVWNRLYTVITKICSETKNLWLKIAEIALFYVDFDKRRNKTYCKPI